MRTGLYHPDEFRDNCGFGLVAHIEGKPSHDLLETAIKSLTCMTHRGGIAADGVTGDGCGLAHAIAGFLSCVKSPGSFSVLNCPSPMVLAWCFLARIR